MIEYLCVVNIMFVVKTVYHLVWVLVDRYDWTDNDNDDNDNDNILFDHILQVI